MHKPNPLGGYPLSLRTSDTKEKIKGELLFDYTTNELHYINKQSGDDININKSILDTIDPSKKERSFINVNRENIDIDGDEPLLPDIEKRKPNNWYFVITERKPI